MKIERQLQGTLNTVFTELIKEKGLDNELHPYTTIEENRADITLKNKSGKTIFFIELKDPTARDGRSVFDGNIIMREAGRAQKGGIKYFGNCNFLACGFFDVERFYDKVSVHEGFFSVQDIARLSSNYTPGKDTIQKLRKIAEFYLERAREIIEKKPVRFSAVDELFVFKIRKLIEVYAPSISTRIWEKYQSDKSFEKEIAAYAKSQLWNRPTTFEEIEKLTHISLLMLISKLIFYKAYVDNQVWHRLHPMKVPDHVCTAAELEAIIWEYFDSFMQITGDFELLIGERSDIIFQMPFLSEDVIHLITDVLNTEGHYNFSKIPYDIIGRIFEELIREDERHKLGQYFTSPIVIDLINAFAIHKSTDIIFDPSCGSGTFLVRAYERKKGLGKLEGVTIQHEELLEQIYGNDLSGYPSYLSMLNLAIRNTREASYPKIINKDFFAITSDTKISLHDQEGTLQKEKLPLFDAIIGNPPYTRQEDIGTMNGTQNKNQIQKLVKKECYFEPSQRTSIYAYFFYHAGVFLKDGGFIAFIVQNSWLETDYGEDLQQYLLSRYKIVSIIDTAVERFFPSASVNTCIIILQKEKDENKRSNNIVKFVYLTKFLKDIVGNSFTPEDLRAWILNTNESIAAEYCNLACVQQDLLTVEKKWGKFLKTPTVYYEIVTKAKGKIKPLGEAAQIRFGIKTGCNEFFIVKDITEQATEKHLFAAVNNSDDFMKLSRVKKQGLRIIENGFDEIWLIEKDLLEPILTSPKDVRKYEFDAEELPYSVVIISDVKAVLKKQFPFAFKYIQWGEKQNFHLRATLSSRNLWYSLSPKAVPPLSFNYIINEYGRTFHVNAYSNNNFHNIYPEKDNARSIWLYMNSTIGYLFQQLRMRNNLGDGAGKIEKYELADFPFIDVNLEEFQLDLGPLKNLKEEFGDLRTIQSVSDTRRRLDLKLLQAIGFHNKEEREKVLFELYKATYQLIENRFLKAQSLKSIKVQRSKIPFEVYLDQLRNMLVESKIKASNSLRFARDLRNLIEKITSETKLQKKIFDVYWKEKYGEIYNEKKVAEQLQGKIF